MANSPIAQHALLATDTFSFRFGVLYISKLASEEIEIIENDDKNGQMITHLPVA